MERYGSTQTLDASFDQELRFFDDKTTWLAEVLNGQMLTTFEYSFDGYDLYSRDGSALSPIFKTAIAEAENLAAKKPQLGFELRRRNIEYEELECMYAIARDELPNTMVVISDFPPELMNASEDIGGYNVRRKQTMMRVITKTADGKLIMRSQSLDGSSREGLEAIYRSCGYEPQPGELLGQRIHKELTPEQQEYLADSLRGVYDRTLQWQYGGEWFAGRKPQDRLNTYDFVLAQKDLLSAYKYLCESGEDNNYSLYNLAAAMQLRLDRFRQETGLSYDIFNQADMMMLISEMSGSGDLARLVGLTFSGCGDTLNAQSEMQESGYGNKTSEEEKYEFDQKRYCIECQVPPKPGEAMKMCGPCGICQPCDTLIRQRNAAKWN